MGIVLTGFKGEAPGVDNQILPSNFASSATNCSANGRLAALGFSGNNVDRGSIMRPTYLHGHWVNAPHDRPILPSPLVDDAIDRVYWLDDAKNLKYASNIGTVVNIDTDGALVSVEPPDAELLSVYTRQRMSESSGVTTNAVREEPTGVQRNIEVGVAYCMLYGDKPQELYFGEMKKQTLAVYDNSYINLTTSKDLLTWVTTTSDSAYAKYKPDTQATHFYATYAATVGIGLFVLRSGLYECIQFFQANGAKVNADSVLKAEYEANGFSVAGGIYGSSDINAPCLSLYNATLNKLTQIKYDGKRSWPKIGAPAGVTKIESAIKALTADQSVTEEPPVGEVGLARSYVITKTRITYTSDEVGQTLGVREESAPSEPVIVAPFYSNTQAVLSFTSPPPDGYVYSIYRAVNGIYKFVADTDDLVASSFIEAASGVTYSGYTLDIEEPDVTLVQSNFPSVRIGLPKDKLAWHTHGNEYAVIKGDFTSGTTSVLLDAALTAFAVDEVCEFSGVVANGTQRRKLRIAEVSLTVKFERVWDATYDPYYKYGKAIKDTGTLKFDVGQVTYKREVTIVEQYTVTDASSGVTTIIPKKVHTKYEILSTVPGHKGLPTRTVIIEEGCYLKIDTDTPVVTSVTNPTLTAAVVGSKLKAASCSLDGLYSDLIAYVDDKDDSELMEDIPSTTWGTPPLMDGIIHYGNGMFMGWYNASLYFCEQYLPHAWDATNTYVIKSNIRGAVALYGGALLVTNQGNYLVQGSSPSGISTIQIDTINPCVSVKSLVSFGDTALYVSASGIVSVSGSGSKLLTDGIIDHQWWAAQEWSQSLAYRCGNLYVISRSVDVNDITFVLDIQKQTIVRSSTIPLIGSYDDGSGSLVVASGNSLSHYDTGGHYEWSSKEFRFNRPQSFSWTQCISSSYPVTVTFSTKLTEDAQLVEIDVVYGSSKPKRFAAGAFHSVVVTVKAEGEKDINGAYITNPPVVTKVVLTTNRQELEYGN